MNKFQKIYSQLQNKEEKTSKISIKGVEKTVKAMVRLTSENYLKDNGEYIKIIFTDGSFLLALKNEEEFYYANELVDHIKEIPDENIGVKEKITYKGREYVLG